MDRADLQQLSQMRLVEAEVLLNNGLYAGSYYLAGYAVECALKACIAKLTNQYDFPNKKRTNDSYTHNLADLAKVAQLDAALAIETSSNPTFAVNWSTVTSQWKEDARYDANITQARAIDLYAAIADSTDGVLIWLMKYW